jgi:hypothetical protein
MTATFRLFTIEARRSIALWFVLPLAMLIAWGTVTTMHPDGAPTIWARSNVQFGLMCVVAAFLMSGVGAWAAGRDRRRQTEELLRTMPRPASLRDIPILAGTLTWGLVACLLAGALVYVVIDREATWGGPDVAPIIVGLLTVVAGTAVGYLGGAIIPSRFAAPLVAVAFASAMLLAGTRSTGVAYLSPFAMDPRGFSPYDVFYQAPTIPLAQTVLWLAGLTACACAATALWRRRTALVFGTFVGALVIATTGAVLTVQAFVHPPWERIYAGQPLAEYELVCVERSIPVCLHPAYEARLQEYADRIGVLVEPLVGVPGGPTRAEQLPSRKSPRSNETLEIIPSELVVLQVTYDLVRTPGAGFNPAQRVIALWLITRTGASLTGAQAFFGAEHPDETAAVARFSALDPDAQRTWLMANFQDLRAGRIEIDDLP